MRLMVRCLPLFLLCALAVRVVAQQPGVELRIPVQALELGEAVSVQLVCTNTGLPDLPEITAIDGLDLRVVNPIPAQFSQTSILNGRVSKKTTFTFSMQLVAQKEGKHSLPSIEVTAGGKTYHTEPIPIVVRSTETVSVPRGDRYMFVEIEVDRTSVYVTESFVATLVFGIRKVQIGQRLYKLNLLRNVLDQRRSQLSVFSGSQVTQSESRLRDSQGVVHPFTTYRIEKVIRAEQVGETLVGPVFLKAQYPTALRRGFFGGLEVSQARTETARADAVVVTVKAPPVRGRSAHFTGAIGRYAMHADAKPKRIRLGQPLTLTIAIQGRPLEGVAGPDLARQPELASRFDFIKDEWVGDVEGGEKVFRRAIFPKQEGEQTIPPLAWSYFDPQGERYVTLTSEPVDLFVEPPESDPNAAVPANSPDVSGFAPTTLTLLTGGISPNYIDPDAVLASQSPSWGVAWGLSALALPPLLCLIAARTAKHRTRLKADTGYARRRHARRRALAAVKKALAQGSDSTTGADLVVAMTHYLADHFNLPPGELTARDVRDVLSLNGVDDGTVEEISCFLEAGEAMRYRPGITDPPSSQRKAADVHRWIHRIEKRL